MEKIPVLDDNQWISQLTQFTHERRSTYRAMYSGLCKSITTNPALMLVPIDDHMVHRGDGVFEAVKITYGGLYLLKEHLERLQQSSQRIHLRCPSLEHIADICHQVTQAAGLQEGQLRVFLARGPGSFSPNPYETIGEQLYVVALESKKIPEEKYVNGVKTGRSAIPVKDHGFAQIKSCNYLHNVLMKKESVDRGLDYTFNFTDTLELAESATENVFIVDKKGIARFPRLRNILRGTTMIRMFSLIQQKTALPTAPDTPISETDLLEAQGVFIAGLTCDVIWVSQYEQKKWERSAHADPFRELLLEDQKKLREQIPHSLV